MGARAAAFLVPMLLVYALAVLTPAGQAIDDHTYPFRGGVDGLAANVFDTVRSTIPVLVTAAVVVVGILSLLRRRWREPLVATVALIVVSLVAQVLRDDVFPRPSYGLDGLFGDVGNTFPSRHVAYTLTACIVFLRLLPAGALARAPWLRAAAAAVAVAVSLASLAAYAHRWSDVVGGALLAGAVGCCLSRGARLPARTIAGARPARWVALAAVVAASAVLAAVPLEAVALWGLTVGAAALVGAIGWVAVLIASADPIEREAAVSLH